jgi:hypothetical protein
MAKKQLAPNGIARRDTRARARMVARNAHKQGSTEALDDSRLAELVTTRRRERRIKIKLNEL